MRRVGPYVLGALVVGALVGALAVAPDSSPAGADPSLSSAHVTRVSIAAGPTPVVVYNATHAPGFSSTRDARHGFLVPPGTTRLLLNVSLVGSAPGTAVGLEDPRGQTVATCASCQQTVKDPRPGAWTVVYPAVGGYSARVVVTAQTSSPVDLGPVLWVNRTSADGAPGSGLEDGFFVPVPTRLHLATEVAGGRLLLAQDTVTITNPDGSVSKTLGPGQAFDAAVAMPGLWRVRYAIFTDQTWTVHAALLGR